MKMSLFPFKKGCCVPKADASWLVIILFMCTTAACVFCCISTALMQWLYKRRIRYKAESSKNRYEEEAKTRKMLEFKMKEMAMRPAHGHHHHQLDRRQEDSKEPISPCITSNADYVQQERFMSNITSSSYFNIPNTPNQPASPPKADLLFTGNTPLSSQENSSLSAPPAPVLFTGATPLQSSMDVLLVKDKNTSCLTAGTECTPISVATSVGAFARSTTEASSAVDAETEMEPRNLAATVHTIAKNWRGEETRPPFPGITLLNKDQRPLGKCPSDKVFQIPSRSESAMLATDKSTTDNGSTPTKLKIPETNISPIPRRATTAHGYVLASLIDGLSESDSRTKTGTKTDLSSKILRKKKSSGEDDVNIRSAGKSSQKRERELCSSKSLKVTGKEPATSAAKSFFPYWIGQQRLFSTVETTTATSSTNKKQVAKITASEINVWEPNGSIRTRIGGSKEFINSSKESTRPPPSIQQPPLNVYELWKQAEGRKLENILQETEKSSVIDQTVVKMP